jgi:Flp pilus assembly protein TadG
MRRLTAFGRDCSGATAVELGLLAPIVFTGVLGIVDLGVYVWDWNDAHQAVRMAARLAATSDPVSSDLTAMTGLETGAAVGSPALAYTRVCSTSCSGGAFDASARSRIFYGPGSAACGDADTRGEAGLCDSLTRATINQMTITYRDSGVDTAGAEGALRPLITVELTAVPSRSVLLSKTLPVLATLPAVRATTLAEDLRSTS